MWRALCAHRLRPVDAKMPAMATSRSGGEESNVYPGPRRQEGQPTGPDAVRRALLDAAADLFARYGASAVTLRDIAAAADVQLGLISRYFGTRREFVQAVFEDLSMQLASDVQDLPLAQHSFERDSTMGRWTRLLTHLALTDEGDPGSVRFNPALALAAVTESEYGLDRVAARLRGAQILASVLGWRLFEHYLIEAADLQEFSIRDLRDELTATHRRLGATPYPSPPDPPRRGETGHR
jgi:AcrR family transcriptional regulator